MEMPLLAPPPQPRRQAAANGGGSGGREGDAADTTHLEWISERHVTLADQVPPSGLTPKPYLDPDH